MKQPTKQQYITPTLKEHGFVSELTQTGSGGSPHHDRGKHKGWNKGKKRKWWKR